MQNTQSQHHNTKKNSSKSHNLFSIVSMHSPQMGHDDYMGLESCDDLRPDLPGPETDVHHHVRGRSRWWYAAEKEYPPPISSAWVMKKCYTGDGRLVIWEEKVKRHEYFQARRSNGRLVLTLVPLDGGAGGEGEEENTFSGEDIDGGGNVGSRDPTVEKVLPERYRYRGIGVTPCGGSGGFGVAAMAALRPPVQI